MLVIISIMAFIIGNASSIISNEYVTIGNKVDIFSQKGGFFCYHFVLICHVLV